jgi:hypothetical protein
MQDRLKQLKHIVNHFNNEKNIESFIMNNNNEREISIPIRNDGDKIIQKM